MRVTFHGGPFHGLTMGYGEVLVRLGLDGLVLEENIPPRIGLSLVLPHDGEATFEYAVCGDEDGWEDRVSFCYRRASFRL